MIPSNPAQNQVSSYDTVMNVLHQNAVVFLNAEVNPKPFASWRNPLGYYTGLGFRVSYFEVHSFMKGFWSFWVPSIGA